jgi:glutaredoxin
MKSLFINYNAGDDVVKTVRKDIECINELGLCPECGHVLDTIEATMNYVKTAGLRYNKQTKEIDEFRESYDDDGYEERNLFCPYCDCDLEFDNEFMEKVLKAADKIMERRNGNKIRKYINRNKKGGLRN